MADSASGLMRSPLPVLTLFAERQKTQCDRLPLLQMPVCWESQCSARKQDLVQAIEFDQVQRPSTTGTHPLPVKWAGLWGLLQKKRSWGNENRNQAVRTAFLRCHPCVTLTVLPCGQGQYHLNWSSLGLVCPSLVHLRMFPLWQRGEYWLTSWTPTSRAAPEPHGHQITGS